MILDSELNDQQKEVIDLGVNWYESPKKQTFEVSGPAGSGKTTIVRKIIQRIGVDPDDALYLAYVGKAAMMLSLNGNNGRTIHSVIYEMVKVPMIGEDGMPMVKNGRVLTMFAFKKRDALPPNIRVIVVDEGSMVNTPIGKDILSFGIPVIVLGDLNQLPPVFGDPFFLINPDYILTKIERQSEDNPIIQLSQMAIKGMKIPHGRYGNDCFVVPGESIPEANLQKIFKSSDIIICGKNKTRQQINDYYRHQILGRPLSNFPVLGDKIICRQNNWKLSVGNGIYLINGLIGYVDNIYLETYNKQSIAIDFRPDFLPDECFTKVDVDYEYLFRNLTEADHGLSHFNKFQYAYAISGYLAQGSEYDKVVVVNERMGSWDFYCKWRYTVYTRARKKLFVID